MFHVPAHKVLASDPHQPGSVWQLIATPSQQQQSNAAPQWPKRADGSPKTFGEMTPTERLQQAKRVLKRLEPEVARVMNKAMKRRDA